MASLNPGESVSATVVDIQPYGAYLRSDGCTILVLVIDMAWKPVPNPKDHLAIGDVVNVRILSYVDDQGVYRGSIKDLHPDQNPLLAYVNVPAWQVFVAKVKNRFADSVTVELPESVRGRIHDPLASTYVTVGDDIEVTVLSVDVDANELLLSLHRPHLGSE